MVRGCSMVPPGSQRPPSQDVLSVGVASAPLRSSVTWIQFPSGCWHLPSMHRVPSGRQSSFCTQGAQGGGGPMIQWLTRLPATTRRNSRGKGKRFILVFASARTADLEHLERFALTSTITRPPWLEFFFGNQRSQTQSSQSARDWYTTSVKIVRVSAGPDGDRDAATGKFEATTAAPQAFWRT